MRGWVATIYISSLVGCSAVKMGLYVGATFMKWQHLLFILIIFFLMWTPEIEGEMQNIFIKDLILNKVLPFHLTIFIWIFIWIILDFTIDFINNSSILRNLFHLDLFHFIFYLQCTIEWKFSKKNGKSLELRTNLYLYVRKPWRLNFFQRNGVRPTGSEFISIESEPPWLPYIWICVMLILNN